MASMFWNHKILDDFRQTHRLELSMAQIMETLKTFISLLDFHRSKKSNQDPHFQPFES